MEPGAAPAERLDPGAAFAIGATVLLALSLLLPWWGVSATVSGRTFSASAHVGHDGVLWVLALLAYGGTVAACAARSRAAVALAGLCCALAIVVVLVLARYHPGLSVAVPHQVHVTPTTLAGAALGVLSAGLLGVGTVLHAVVCARRWQQSSRPAPR